MDNNNNDFGFSLVSEEEIRKHEELLKKQIAEQTEITMKVHKNAESLSSKVDNLKIKLNGLRDMVLPLLNNLSKDPDRQYILWPNRAEKIAEFIQKMNNYIETAND